jgi:hypothetical protein
MKDFMAETPNMLQRKSNGPPQSAAEGIDMHQKHEEDEEELPERGHSDDEEEHKANANGDASAMVAHLSCAKHGGPEDEFAQEMVYWQDIPSDARYVSPFHSKHSQEKRYMVRTVALLLFHRLFFPTATFAHNSLILNPLHAVHLLVDL